MKAAIARPKLPRTSSLIPETVESLGEEATLSSVSIRQGALQVHDAPMMSIQQSLLATVELADADFSGMTAVDTRLEQCDLSNVTIANGRWTRVEANGCKLTGAIFNQTLLQDVWLSECRADYAQLQSIKSQRVAFDRCNLHHAYFNNADLSGVRFVNCDLSGADFTQALLDGVDLRGSNLENIVITIEQLRGVTVSSDQALYLCGLIGLRIDDSAPMPA